MADTFNPTYHALYTENDVTEEYVGKDGKINFEKFLPTPVPEFPVAENVPEAAGEAPTAAEFKALLDALIDAGLMKPASEDVGA